MDDVLVVSESKLQHEDHLRTVFERLDRFGLLLNVNKCIFGDEQIDFLGYSISSTGTKPLPQKVQAILDYKKTTHSQRVKKVFRYMINFKPKLETVSIILKEVKYHTTKVYYI